MHVVFYSTVLMSKQVLGLIDLVSRRLVLGLRVFTTYRTHEAFVNRGIQQMMIRRVYLRDYQLAMSSVVTSMTLGNCLKERGN